MLRLLTASLVLAAVSVGVLGDCVNPESTEFNGKCYAVYNGLDFSAYGQTYENAAEFCKTNKSGLLASVTSRMIQVFLTSMLKEVQNAPGAWIGLNDKATEGTYKWESGDPYDESLSNWAKGYPENSMPNQDCVRMTLDFNNPGMWKDAPCDVRSSFICENDASLPVLPGPKCRIGGHDDYSAYYFFCFKVLTTPMTYADAKSACTLPGYEASLATVIAGFHSSFIQSMMFTEKVSSAWIGLESKGGNTFSWNDGSPYVFSDWGPNEPSMNTTSQTEGCVSAEIDSDSNSDWMSGDCNEKKPAVCSLLTAPIPKPPLNARGQCPDDFTADEYWCYHNETTPKNWTAAQEQCKEVYSDSFVAVPHDISQNRLIAVSNSFASDSLWLGISRDEEDQKFQALDGKPIDFVFWEDGQPEGMADNENCISVSKDETWRGRDCSEEKEFICAVKKINAPIDHGGCRDGWFKFGNKCYRYFNEEAMFGEAATKCRNSAIGGNLAAIESRTLQHLLAFLMNQFSGSDTPSDVWIGLWDIYDEGTFSWVNGETFGFFDNWAPGQPDGYLHFDNLPGADDCVKMVANPSMPGQWDDVDCYVKLPYLCECYLDPDITPQPIAPGPSICGIPNYIQISNTCLRLETELLTFEEAEKSCTEEGGHLATAPDGYIDGFLQFLVSVNQTVSSAWIGLSDVAGNGEYNWTYPSIPVTYTNWGADSPAKGKCVAVEQSSNWLNDPCDEKHSSICEAKFQLPEPPEWSPWHCEEGWIEYKGNCYNFDTYDGGARFYHSYAQARQACARDGATLASLHSVEDNLWFYIKARFLLGKRKVWLGMHRSPSPSDRMMWNDGSAVNYVNWADDEPNGRLDGSDCITMYAGNEGLGEWSDTNCFELNAYACQKQAIKGNPPICEPEWEQVLVKSVACLYFSRPEDGQLSWVEAEAFCNNKGAHLVSILDPIQENIYSYYLPKYFGSDLESWPWLGYRFYTGASEYTWSDGYHSTFSNWGSGQPADNVGDCAVHEVRGLHSWFNINCGLHRPFVCKKNSTSTEPIIKPPTEMPPANMGCAGGTRIGNVCYKLVTEEMSWEDARQTCAAEKNGDLASIPEYAVQVLITTLLTLVEQKDIWIGMSSKMPGSNYIREFHWVDGNIVAFTNWASGQPNLPLDKDHCVKMLNDPDVPGQWYDDLCDQKYPSICQYDLTVGGVKPPPDLGTECPDGFEGLKPACFKIDTVPRSYSSALSFCEDQDTILAPVENGYEDAFIELMMFSYGVSSAWIGLRSNEETSGSYKWSADNWPLTFTNWGDQEPSSEKGCVASVFAKGWQSVDCFNPIRATICRSKEDTPPSSAPVDPDLRCPETWYPLGDQCFLIDTGFESDNVLNAFFKCSSLSGLPPSVHSRDENLFVRNTVLNELSGRYVWLGLVLSEGKYKWMDESPVEYTNWKEGEDTSLDDGKDCVVMAVELDGKWERRACTEQSQVICKRPSGVRTTNVPATTNFWMVTYQANTGIGVGPLVGIIVGGAVGLIVLLVGACYLCDKKKEENWSSDHPEGPRNVRLNTDVELRIRGPAEEKGEGSGNRTSDSGSRKSESSSHKSDSDSKNGDGVSL